MHRTRVKTVMELVLIGIFLGVIYAPPLKALLSPVSGYSIIEKRELAPAPKIAFEKQALENFSSAFEAFYNDHFGFREKLIKEHNRIMKKWFGKSGVSKVMVGKENWLYYSSDQFLEDFLGTNPLTTDELEAWKTSVERKQAWLSKRGIHYLFVIAPNKQTIYPEYMPSYFNKIRRKTRMDQLLEYFDSHSQIKLLDLRQVLRPAKKDGLIYYRTDSHWNDRGAFIAYQAMMHRISEWFPQEEPLDPSLFKSERTSRKGGDLAVMLGLTDALAEERPSFRLISPCAKKLPLDWRLPDADPEKPTTPVAMGCSRAGLRAVIFRDSFFNALVPFFSEHFSQVVYFNRAYRPEDMEEIIQRIRPDLVIEERVERRIHDLPDDAQG